MSPLKGEPSDFGDGSLTRREFLRLMAASLALAGIPGCTTRQPKEKILPYVNPPTGLVPGKPRLYATSLEIWGQGVGLLVKNEMGRPIKIEGNPLHPWSLGASDIFAQASLLTLYDPARSATVLRQGLASTWGAFCGELAAKGQVWRSDGGKGLRVLIGPLASPSAAAALAALLQAYPEAALHAHDPLDSGHAIAGTALFSGERAFPVPRFSEARVIVSLEADFLGFGGGVTRYSRDFAAGRRPEAATGNPGQAGMNRLYAAEGCPSLTGAMADQRLVIRSTDVPGLALRLAEALGLPGFPGLAGGLPDEAGEVGETGGAGGGKNATPEARAWVTAAAQDLSAHRGRGLIVAGESQGAETHALVLAMNDFLGNLGATLDCYEPAQAAYALSATPLSALVADMAAGRVDTLLVLESNPAYTQSGSALSQVGFAEALAKVPLSIHSGCYRDETAALCRWHVPAAHGLEAWGDCRSPDGTLSLVQPMIAPLYGGRTRLEVIGALRGGPGADREAYAHVRDYWQSRFRAGGFPGAAGKSRDDPERFAAFWERCLAEGVIAGSAAPPKPIHARAGWEKAIWAERAASAQRSRAAGRAPDAASGGRDLEIAFRPDPTVGDGSFSENAWLQELPKPLTKLTWDNAALLSPATARRLGVANRDDLELEYRGRRLSVPAWILPGHADDQVTLTFGYGRRHDNPIARGAGYDAYALRYWDAPWQDRGLAVRKTGRAWNLADTQAHHGMEGRDPARTATLAEFTREKTAAQPSLYPAFPYPGHAWGMAIDLSLCTGCSACVVACQAENNIPVVGKDQVARGREMHWIRVDAYFQGMPENPGTVFQPVPCMHCENAPCELVCPVEATVHDSEGLNAMVYNRCVGTRYCSNNCPYKVRRFNFFQYADLRTESLKLMRNPDVTVRSRGVMEKCTYCVQRIEKVRIEAELAERSIRDGEVVTACAQACPTGAIVFGDCNDAAGRVAAMKRSGRNYALLGELNTRPRTTYLSRIRNPPTPQGSLLNPQGLILNPPESSLKPEAPA